VNVTVSTGFEDTDGIVWKLRNWMLLRYCFFLW